MKADGSCPVDYSIRCYNCEKPLRSVDGTDIEDIHSDEDGEDICEACYRQHVELFGVTDKDGEVVGYDWKRRAYGLAA